MATKTAKPENEYRIPESIEAAASVQIFVAAKLNALIRAETKLVEDKRKLDEKAAPELEKLRTEAVGWAKALYRFAEANRAMITKDGAKKTIDLLEKGEVSWYDTPGRVNFTGEPEDIISEFRRRKVYRRFTRVTVKINKEALLEDPDLARNIPGIEIVSGEKFAVLPAETNARVERDFDGTWAIVNDKRRQQVG